MPTSSRTNKNMEYVRRKLLQAKAPTMLDSEILDVMNDVEKDLCDRFGALQGTFTVTLNAGATGIYAVPAGTGRILSMVKPTDWSQVPIIVTSAAKFAEVKSLTFNASTIPFYVFLWNNSLEFWPVPSWLGTLTFYSYKVPTTLMTEGTGDPTVSSDWDFALRYGTLADLLGGPFPNLYEETANRQAHTVLVQGGPIEIDSTFKQVNF